MKDQNCEGSGVTSLSCMTDEELMLVKEVHAKGPIAPTSLELPSSILANKNF